MDRVSALSAVASVILPASFFALALCELLVPAQATASPYGLRWFGNTAVFALGSLVMLPIPFMAAISVSIFAQERGLGLLNTITHSPVLAVPLSVIALDLAAYWEHRVFHWFRPLWRLHALHHSDTDTDVTTYIRHHPGEAVVQALFDAAVVVAFGFDPLSLALFTLLTGIVQIAAHANVDDSRFRWLGAFFVTPDLHRLHHSREFDENNSNFSHAFSVWDRIFGTIRHQARGTLRFGLPEFADAKFQRVDRMLLLPLLVGNSE